MKNYALAAVAALALIGATAPAMADTTAFNSTPADTWYFGTTGNDTQGDTGVLTTTAGDQLYLRWKQFNIGSPGSNANGLYSFALGQGPLSFDWGFDTSGSFPTNLAAPFANLTALLTITNLGTGGTFSYNPLVDPSNDYTDRAGNLNGSVQNSSRLTFGFLAPVGYNANVNGTYRVRLDVGGLVGGSRSFSVDAQVGTGAAAVPEPATWGLMLAGFGMVGAGLRSRRRSTVVTYA